MEAVILQGILVSPGGTLLLWIGIRGSYILITAGRLHKSACYWISSSWAGAWCHTESGSHNLWDLGIEPLLESGGLPGSHRTAGILVYLSSRLQWAQLWPGWWGVFPRWAISSIMVCAFNVCLHVSKAFILCLKENEFIQNLGSKYLNFVSRKC
jgi:hypothetical protein